MGPKAIVLIFSIILVFRQAIGTSPTLPPYHQYLVSGTIVRGPGLPLGNFVVYLKGKFSSPWSLSPHDSLVSLEPYRVPSDHENYPAVTDSTGRFTVIIATQPIADSLAIEITAADKSVARGDPIGVPPQGLTLTTSFTEVEPGCSGCTSSATDRTKIIGYQHFLQDHTITLPF